MTRIAHTPWLLGLPAPPRGPRPPPRTPHCLAAGAPPPSCCTRQTGPGWKTARAAARCGSRKNSSNPPAGPPRAWQPPPTSTRSCGPRCTPPPWRAARSGQNGPHDARIRLPHRRRAAAHRQRCLCDGARCLSDRPAHGNRCDQDRLPLSRGAAGDRWQGAADATNSASF